MSPLRVVVVDDEPPARQRLEDLLSGHEDVQLAGSFGDPHRAVQTLLTEPVDLVFLDVQMPGLTGLDVVRLVGPERMPATVFVTAYDRYALQAFDLAALDYLLKPFDDERFEQALARARERLRLREVDDLTRRLRALLDPSGPTLPAAPMEREIRHLERIAVEVKGQRLLIPAEQIDYIAADGPYAEIHTSGKTYLLRERMHVLERDLDPRHFVRIHRSTIVNVERIAALEPLFRGDHVVRLRDGTRLKLSRERREELARRLGIPI
ncbi:MAG TPA: LytTR family DNA-binding domain-containing protein [Longimicrobiaceae bacterium]|nr:LytTR family DNA-binding domain-containing protein [Longimicrobiaceae bacterium]